MLLEAGITVPSSEKSILVPRESIQLINDHSCVFVRSAHGFVLKEVILGRTDRFMVEIRNGLKGNETIARKNSFHLKAEYIKNAAGDHAGCHGHSH
jgi:cobalt-zinc-cadmium efflux system membrane fusion protein